jgi:hypothetical protein
MNTELNTAEDIRKALIKRYPDVNDYEYTIEHSGLAHDNPIMAIDVVLISSLVLGTTDPVKLAQFTKYSERFIRAIASNLKNSGIWKDNKYDCSSWFSGGLIPSTDAEDYAFWEHVEIAAGDMWRPHANTDIIQDSNSIFWDDMRREGKARGLTNWLAPTGLIQ